MSWLTSTGCKALLVELSALVKTLRLDFSLATAAECAACWQEGPGGMEQQLWTTSEPLGWGHPCWVGFPWERLSEGSIKECPHPMW